MPDKRKGAASSIKWSIPEDPDSLLGDLMDDFQKEAEEEARRRAEQQRLKELEEERRRKEEEERRLAEVRRRLQEEEERRRRKEEERLRQLEEAKRKDEPEPEEPASPVEQAGPYAAPVAMVPPTEPVVPQVDREALERQERLVKDLQRKNGELASRVDGMRRVSYLAFGLAALFLVTTALFVFMWIRADGKAKAMADELAGVRSGQAGLEQQLKAARRGAERLEKAKADLEAKVAGLEKELAGVEDELAKAKEQLARKPARPVRRGPRRGGRKPKKPKGDKPINLDVNIGDGLVY